MLASWRGARLEVIQVLREVVDNVLKEPGASDQVLYNRAKVRFVSDWRIPIVLCRCILGC